MASNLIAIAEGVSEKDYLAGELESEVKHEFISGQIYAMAGATRAHNRISGNLFSALDQHLKGNPCEVFMADMKVKLDARGDDIFYYPDVVVDCSGSLENSALFVEEPKVIIEVLSESTKRLDKREKFWAYIENPTVEEYITVAQDSMALDVRQRSSDFSELLLLSSDDTLHLPSLGFSLKVTEIYSGLSL